MAESTGRIIVTAPTGEERSYTLSGDRVAIGRDAGNDIVVQEARVSRHHATLFSGCWSSAGFGTISQTWRSMGCFMKAIAIRFGPAACNIALSATGWWIAMKSSPSFSRGSQREGKQTERYSARRLPSIALRMTKSS